MLRHRVEPWSPSILQWREFSDHQRISSRIHLTLKITTKNEVAAAAFQVKQEKGLAYSLRDKQLLVLSLLLQGLSVVATFPRVWGKSDLYGLFPSLRNLVSFQHFSQLLQYYTVTAIPHFCPWWRQNIYTLLIFPAACERNPLITNISGIPSQNSNTLLISMTFSLRLA